MQSVAFKTSVSDEDFIELSKVNGVLGFFDKTIEDIGIPVTIEFNDIAVGTKYFVILAVVINDNLSYFGSSSDDFFMNGILKPLSKYNQIEKGINNIQISMKKVSNGLNFAFCKKDGDSYKFNNGLALLYYKDWPTNMLDINCNKDYLEISRNETESTVSFTKKAASEVMWNSYVVSNLNKKLKANTNYTVKVKLMVTGPTDGCTIGMQITDSARSKEGIFVANDVKSEWGEYTIETGKCGADWFAHLDICTGNLNENQILSVKDLSIEESTSQVENAFSIWNSDLNSGISSDKKVVAYPEDYCFEYNYQNDVSDCWALLGKVSNLKVDEDGVLYKCTANVSSSSESSFFGAAFHSTDNDYESGFMTNQTLTVGEAKTITLYTPCYLGDLDYKFACLVLALGSNGTLSVKDVSVSPTTIKAEELEPCIVGTATAWQWIPMTENSDGSYEKVIEITSGDTLNFQVVLKQPNIDDTNTTELWKSTTAIHYKSVVNKSSFTMSSPDNDAIPLTNNSSTTKYCKIKLTPKFKIELTDVSSSTGAVSNPSATVNLGECSCYYYDISSISTDPISIIFNRQISGLQTNDIANISSSSSSYWYWNGENCGFHKQLTADDVVKYISTSNTGIGNQEEASNRMKLFWAILLIMLPIALIFNESSMYNLQSVSIIAAFPIAIVIIMIIASFIKDAKRYIKNEQK